MRKMKDSGIEWIGEIPESWEVHRVKNHFSIISGSGFKTDYQGDESGDFPVCKASDISNAGHKLYGSANYISQEVQRKEGFSVIPAGSILFAKIGEAMRKNNRTLTMVDACADNNCQAMVPQNMHSEYAYYLFSCIDMQWFDNAGTIPCINNTKLLDFKMAYPSMEEQLRIADYLDQKCAEIDAIISAKEKTNELLKERRQSIIYEAVTKGLEPTVPMKDSGIEWIGEIPEKFQLIRLKYLCEIFGRIGFRGYTQADLVAEGEGPITLSPSNISENGMDYSKCTYLTWDKYYESPEIQIENNDILLVKTGSSYGKSTIVENLPMEATINPQFVVMKNIKCHPKFLHYIMQTKIIKYQVEQVVVGGTIPTMAQEKINNFHIVLPSEDEICNIVNYLDGKCAECDTLISGNEATIQKLKEYRQSVIYEAVTGKVEI